MSSIFKLLIAVIVFGVLLYFILGMFVFPKDDPYLNISKTLLLAKQDAGNPYCGTLNLEKNKNINTKSLLLNENLSNLNMYVWFSSFNTKYTIFKSPDYFSISSKDNVKNLDYCGVCYPGFVFSPDLEFVNVLQTKNLFCEVLFGKKLLSLEYNFVNIEDNESQGIKNITLDKLPDDYSYFYFVFNNDNRETLTKESLALFKAQNNSLEIYKYFNSNSQEMEIPKAGPKIIVQALLPKDINPRELILPAKFSVKSVMVLPNNDYQIKDCLPTTIEKQYIDMDKQMCLVYYNCTGCTMADQCSEVWNNSGKITESVSPLFAKGYDTLETNCP